MHLSPMTVLRVPSAQRWALEEGLSALASTMALPTDAPLQEGDVLVMVRIVPRAEVPHA